jgi:signal transduction histidine kinase
MRFKATLAAGGMAGYLGKLQDEAVLATFKSDVSDKSTEGGYRLLVFDINNRVLDDSNRDTLVSRVGSTMIVPEVMNALTRRDQTQLRRNQHAIYAASAILDENSNKIGAVLLVSSVEAIYRQLDQVLFSVLMYSLLSGLFIIVLVIFVSQLLLDPLRKILRVVQKITIGHLSERIPVNGRDEYSELARAYNDMTEKLEQVDKTREEFVSNVSHELKTPLSSMKVLSESLLLQEQVPAETYREFLTDITSEVDRMANIVNDLLALVKIDQREQGLHIQPTDLNKTVEDILKRLSPLAEQKKVVLLYEDVRAVLIDADEMKLSLAISNIVENGIKYTPRGGTVKVIVDADHQNAFVTIQDTGIGISDEEQSKIFNRFYRVDKTRDRETGGTGLGLAISHSTVLMHNGSIRLTSKPDEGSVFVVRIPLRRS